MNDNIKLIAGIFVICTLLWGTFMTNYEIIDELKQINKTLESFAEWNGGSNEPS